MNNNSMKFLFIYFIFLTQFAVAQVFDIDSLKHLKRDPRSAEPEDVKFFKELF